MINFALQGYYSYKGLFHWLNWPAYISNVFLGPFLMVVMITLLGRFAGDPERGEVYLVGMAAYSIPRILLAGISQSFSNGMAFGTLSLIFGSRSSRLMIYASKGLLHYPNGIQTVVTILFFSWLILDFDLSETDWLTMSLAVVLIVASCTAFALFVGNFVIIFREWFVVMSVTNLIMFPLTGVIIPRASLPGVLSEVGHVLPLTHGLVAFRESFTGASVASVGNDLLLELAVGLAYAVGGFLLFRLVEAAAKRRGLLEDVA